MSGPTSTKIQSDIPQLLARSTVYGMLSVLFRHPGGISPNALKPQALKQFSSSSFPQALSGNPEDRSPIKTLGDDELNYYQVLERWREAASDLSLGERLRVLLKNLECTSREDWIRDYERAFGHSAHGTCPPYELEYGEEHSHRQPQELGDIAAFYQAFGLGLSGRGHERVDHVSVECEFMHYLIFKQAYALQNGGHDPKIQGDTSPISKSKSGYVPEFLGSCPPFCTEKAAICQVAARNYLADHLGRWLPAFAHSLARHTGQGLIKALADFAFDFVVRDCERTGVPVGSRDLPIRMTTPREEDGCTSCSLGKKQVPFTLPP